jgi:hypothetical protein
LIRSQTFFVGPFSSVTGELASAFEAMRTCRIRTHRVTERPYIHFGGTCPKLGVRGISWPTGDVITGPINQDEFEPIYQALKKAVIERAMNAQRPSTWATSTVSQACRPGHQRSGTSGKIAITDDGRVEIDAPRDREGRYAPLIVGKHERRFTTFDQKIIAMYARGMTVQETQGYLAGDVRHRRVATSSAAIKLLWLALRNINDGKVRSARRWKLALISSLCCTGIASSVTRVMQPP